MSAEAIAAQPLVRVRNVMGSKALTVDEIVDGSGFGLIEVLEILHLLRAEVNTYGSPAAGYVKRWTLPEA